MSKVTIHHNRSENGVKSSIEIDGKAVQGCFNVEFYHAVGEPPVIKLALYPTEVEIVGDIDVERVVICPSCRERQEIIATNTKLMVDLSSDPDSPHLVEIEDLTSFILHPEAI